MRTMFYGLLAVAAIAIATPATAQLRIETPVGGVRVGSDRHYDRGRDYDRPRHQYLCTAVQWMECFARFTASKALDSIDRASQLKICV
jgi:hypothetical protein